MSNCLLPFDPREVTCLQCKVEGYYSLTAAQQKRAEALIVGEALHVHSEVSETRVRTVALMTLEGIKVGYLPRMFGVHLYGYDACLAGAKVTSYNVTKQGRLKLEVEVRYNASTPLALTSLSLYPGIDQIYTKVMPAYARVVQGLRQSPYESMAGLSRLVQQSPQELYLTLRLVQLSAKLESPAVYKERLLQLQDDFGLQHDALIKGWLREVNSRIKACKAKGKQSQQEYLLSHASTCFESGLYAYALQGYLLALQEGVADEQLVTRIGEIYDICDCHTVN